MDQALLGEIKKAIAENKVVLFMKGSPDFPQCGFSAATVQVLREIAAPFVAMDLFSHPDFRATLKEYSDWPTFPQLYVDGKLIGGCDIVREMHARGELKPLIDKALGKN